MPRMIFINLPVTDLAASVAFYRSLGFTDNPHCVDDEAAGVVWSDTIHVMLLTHAKWRSFTSRPIAPPTSSEVFLALACDSRAAVDAMTEAAGANGGTADINPVHDLGVLYSRVFADPDGHVWEPLWMDPAAMPPNGAKKAEAQLAD